MGADSARFPALVSHLGERVPYLRSLLAMTIRAEASSSNAVLRRALFFATAATLTIMGAWLMAEMFRPNGVTGREVVLLVLFVILFSQITIGFCLALFGWIVSLRGKDPAGVMALLPPGIAPDLPLAATAIVMPVFNEDVARVFRGVENMFRSLDATPHARHFDFFILSDSNQPDNWVAEECAWLELCRKLSAFGRIFYRRRRVPVHGKSGNVADFCRRWGRRYRYMVVLDADSIMTGTLLVRLVQAMEQRPRAGIIQTAPALVLGESLFRRALQFSTRLGGRIFSAGSHFWHQASGSYWGHNAIIRVQPFIDACDLPDIPGPGGTRLHVMSHDTVEAALMRQAGYEVWFAHDEEGSYEEGPPNLNESLKRDRRWCQGNLQHFWFLFARNLRFANRLHIYFGLLAYLSAPLWLLWLVLSTVDVYEKQRFAVLSATRGDLLTGALEGAPLMLLVMTAVFLFLPKFLGLTLLLPNARKFGGVAGALATTFLDILLSMIAAPILMWFYSKFVVLTALGRRIAWKTQNRGDSGGITWGDAVRLHFEPTLVGAAGVLAVWLWMPWFLIWLSPVLAGLLLSIPFAYFSSLDSLGRAARRLHLFVIPEEMEPPPVLDALDGSPAGPSLGRHTAARAIVDPYVHAVHASLLRPRRSSAGDALRALRARFLTAGPDALTPRERMALLSDPQSIDELHRAVWTSPDAMLHPVWRKALFEIPSSASTKTLSTIPRYGIADGRPMN
jgi:membrane glycosyltransferase